MTVPFSRLLGQLAAPHPVDGQPLLVAGQVGRVRPSLLGRQRYVDGSGKFRHELSSAGRPLLAVLQAFFAASCTLLIGVLVLALGLGVDELARLVDRGDRLMPVAFCPQQDLAVVQEAIIRPLSLAGRHHGLNSAGAVGSIRWPGVGTATWTCAALSRRQHPLDRLGPRMRRQPEGAPVDRHQQSRARVGDIQVRPDRLLGVHVNVRPGRVVGADGHQRHVERSVVGADLREALGVAGVAAEIRAMRRDR